MNGQGQSRVTRSTTRRRATHAVGPGIMLALLLASTAHAVVVQQRFTLSGAT